jgi:hypothetical protein
MSYRPTVLGVRNSKDGAVPIVEVNAVPRQQQVVAQTCSSRSAAFLTDPTQVPRTYQTGPRYPCLPSGTRSERTRAGVKPAQRRGVKFGRKRKLTPQQITHARELIHNGEARHHVAALLNVDRVTLYRALT